MAEKIEPKFCSIKELSEVLGLGTTRIYAALASGELIAVKVGVRTLVDLDAATDWMKGRPRWKPSHPVAPRTRTKKKSPAGAA